MARKRAARSTTVDDVYTATRSEYEARLAKPAVLPWAGTAWPPVALGPTWQVDPATGQWKLPTHTLGWEVLAFSGVTFQHAPGVPWRYTLEQARFVLWWYALDDHGRFAYRDGVLQRLKGWGKDPLGACLAAVEMIGPCRFGGWDSTGEPIAIDVPDAWVQIAAVSLEQTKNTMRIFPSLFTPEAVRQYRLAIGKEMIHGLSDTRLIQAVTSSPKTLEGARSSFVLRNETHHWLSNNEGHEMDAVIDRNVTKSADGAARALSITNAYEPSEDSVAQQAREAWEAIEAGRSIAGGIMYDSLEAPAKAPLSAAAAPEVVAAIRGDSVWLDVDRIVAAILDPRNPPSRSRRFWFNQITAAEDSWLMPQHVDAAADPELRIDLTDEVVLFFDGSKSDDATAVVGCRLSDGHVFTVGVWQRPAGAQGDGWVVNRHDVDQVVRAILDTHNVVAFWGDPSHTQDDDHTPFWENIIDGWHRDYHDRFTVWAVGTPGSTNGHSVMWDMAADRRQKSFTKSAERFVADITEGLITHDGHPALRQHLKNARRYPTRHGVSLWKGHRESSRKVDAAVCAVGARMLRRIVLNKTPAPASGSKKKPGRVW